MVTKNQSTKRRGMPKPKAVKDFWAAKLFSLRKILDVDEILEPWDINGVKLESCFCCGACGKLERAHIKPIYLGGDNSVANIHMLCPKCHLDSEAFSGDSYWRWFLSHERKCPLLHEYPALSGMGFSDIDDATEYYIEMAGGDSRLAIAMFRKDLSGVENDLI